MCIRPQVRLDHVLPYCSALASRQLAIPIRMMTTTKHEVTDMEAIRELSHFTRTPGTSSQLV
jgi:hypothetical protein